MSLQTIHAPTRLACGLFVVALGVRLARVCSVGEEDAHKAAELCGGRAGRDCARGLEGDGERGLLEERARVEGRPVDDEEVGEGGGNRALGEVHERVTLMIARGDAEVGLNQDVFEFIQVLRVELHAAK
mgnify:CR=1 FL=1